MTSLSGLDNLELVDGYMELSDLFKLENLSPLSNLKQVSGILTLWNLRAITNLSGLANLSLVGGLDIEGNNNNNISSIWGVLVSQVK